MWRSAVAVPSVTDASAGNGLEHAFSNVSMSCPLAAALVAAPQHQGIPLTRPRNGGREADVPFIPCRPTLLGHHGWLL
jgi:hypothetical protein